MERSDLDETESSKTFANKKHYGSEVDLINDIEISDNSSLSPRSTIQNSFQSTIKRPFSAKTKSFSKKIPFALDKTCSKCNKKYSSNSNSIFSCNFHKYSWNGAVYTCCNSKNQYSSGCKTSKHITIEHSKPVIRCSSCKELGHLCSQCPKDPNTRTGMNPMHELQRIANLNQQRPNTKVKTIRKYEIEADDFGDIAKLKAVIKDKKGILSPSGHSSVFSLATEEEEAVTLKKKQAMIRNS